MADSFQLTERPLLFFAHSFGGVILADVCQVLKLYHKHHAK